MDNERNIVNGSQLPRFKNKPISIIGKVGYIEPSGTSFYLVATDDFTVTVNVRRHVNLRIGGWVEVRGIFTGRAIDAEHVVIFSNEKFDTKAHNTLCTLLYSVPNIWKTS